MKPFTSLRTKFAIIAARQEFAGKVKKFVPKKNQPVCQVDGELGEEPEDSH